MIIGTCGHQLDPKWHESGRGAIRVRSHDREWNKSVDYIMVCPQCKGWYENEGLTLHTEEEVNEWLRQEKGE